MMGAPFLFLNLAGSGRIGFHKKKIRQAERILLCFRLPVDWVCVPETMDLIVKNYFADNFAFNIFLTYRSNSLMPRYIISHKFI